MKEALSTLTTLLADFQIDYIVYAAIGVVTLIGVVKCLLPLWTTTRALRRAIHHLQAEAGQSSERPVWQEPRFMGRRLKGSWMRFLQNAEQLDRRGLPCNVEDYINDDTVTHGPGNAQLAELIPSLLTSLGILGTFIGMTRGLAGIDLSTTDSMMSGINTLIAGMQFAFGTSVAGVSCSLVFNMVNRIAQGSSYRAIDDFVESFTQLAMQRPLDNDVELICQNQDSNHLLSTMSDTLSSQMASSIEVAISRAMQPVAKSMDSFLVGATRAQVDGVGTIVNQFVDRMNASLNNQFLVLGQTLTEINQHQQLTFQQLDQSMRSASQIVMDVKQLQGVSQDVINHFEHYITELSSARTRDERFEQSSADLLGRMRQANDEQIAALSRLKSCQEDLTRTMGQFTQLSRDSLNLMRQADEANAAQLSKVSKTMQEAGRDLSHSYQGFVQNVVEGLSRALGLFDQNMQELLSALTERLSQVQACGTSGDTMAQLSELQRMMTSIQSALEKAEPKDEDQPAAPDKEA